MNQNPQQQAILQGTDAQDIQKGTHAQSMPNASISQANTDELLTNIALYISQNDAKQQELLKDVTDSLNQIPPQEREGWVRGTANAFSAFEKGIDLKAGAKWAGYTAGIGLVSVLGGCLAKAHMQGGDLGDNLKEVMSEIFPEALVALAATALLMAVARTLFGAFSGAAEQIASANDKRIVANAQEQINTALSDIKKNPLNVEAFKKLEDATKTLLEHGSTKVLDKNGSMQPILATEQVQSYKKALQNISQAKPYAKLKAVANLLQGSPSKGTDTRTLTEQQKQKNIDKGKSDRNTEKNAEYAKRLAQTLGIKMSSTSNTLTPTVTAVQNQPQPPQITQ